MTVAREPRLEGERNPSNAKTIGRLVRQEIEDLALKNLPRVTAHMAHS
jgi:hypothetical protein